MVSAFVPKREMRHPRVGKACAFRLIRDAGFREESVIRAVEGVAAKVPEDGKAFFRSMTLSLKPRVELFLQKRLGIRSRVHGASFFCIACAFCFRQKRLFAFGGHTPAGGAVRRKAGIKGEGTDGEGQAAPSRLGFLSAAFGTWRSQSGHGFDFPHKPGEGEGPGRSPFCISVFSPGRATRQT